jgi:hypothetical protein
MKKVLILSITALLFASCSKSGYDTLTTTTNNNNSAVSPATVDPASNFNTIWIGEATAVSVTDVEKRNVANFFGYNTAHYAMVVPGNDCPYGYTGEYVTGPCYGAGDFLRDYSTTSDPVIGLFPAPMDIGTISSYEIRFAADVDPATRDVEPGSAYLQLIVNTPSATLSRELVTMQTSINVVQSGVCQNITASWTDGCGTVTFTASVCDGALSNQLQSANIIFQQSLASYKNASCYYGGVLPVDPMELKGTNDITSIPSTSLFPNTPLVNLIQQ